MASKQEPPNREIDQVSHPLAREPQRLPAHTVFLQPNSKANKILKSRGDFPRTPAPALELRHCSAAPPLLRHREDRLHGLASERVPRDGFGAAGDAHEDE